MTQPLDALKTILPMAGWSRDVSSEVTFSGAGDPMMRTPFHVGTGGAATIAAAGLAAAHLPNLTLRQGELFPGMVRISLAQVGKTPSGPLRHLAPVWPSRAIREAAAN
jgi:hypothetical protein